jgi:serine/threonine protein kinase
MTLALAPMVTMEFRLNGKWATAPAAMIHGGKVHVYQALVPGLAAPVTVKCGRTERLAREARVLRQLKRHHCRYIVRTWTKEASKVTLRGRVRSHDSEEEGGVTMLAFEFCPATLEDLLRGPRLSTAHVALTMQQLMTALQDLRVAGIAHGRLSAEHVLIHLNKEDVKLTGFGEALADIFIEERIDGSSDKTPRSTVIASASASAADNAAGRGGSVYTRRFPQNIPWDSLAPEVAAILNSYDLGFPVAIYDAAIADMWAAGVLLFRMACGGEAPFRDDGRSTFADYLAEPARAALAHNDRTKFWKIQQDRNVVSQEMLDDRCFAVIASWIEALLVWDPSDRGGPDVVLRHPWFEDAAPHVALHEVAQERQRILVAEVAMKKALIEAPPTILGPTDSDTSEHDASPLAPVHPTSITYASGAITVAGTPTVALQRVSEVAQELGFRTTRGEDMLYYNIDAYRSHDPFRMRVTVHAIDDSDLLHIVFRQVLGARYLVLRAISSIAVRVQSIA